ncbi:MAG: hypothetical protein ABIF10_04405 [Candidatus Woesearchaeota archaeon]
MYDTDCQMTKSEFDRMTSHLRKNNLADDIEANLLEENIGVCN